MITSNIKIKEIFDIRWVSDGFKGFESVHVSVDIKLNKQCT